MDEHKEHEKRRSSLRNRKLNIDHGVHEIITPKDRTIKWDLTEAENYLNSSEHSNMKKINDPKTPYVEIEETDDVYLKKLKEVNKLEATKDILEEVAKKIEEHNQQLDDEEKSIFININ